MTEQQEPTFKTAKRFKFTTNANASNTDTNMCKVHQSDSFSHFCITCSGKICALCTQENAEHYQHKTIDLDTLDSYKRTLSGSGQVEDVSNCIDKAKASFDAINKLVSKLNGTAKSRIKELNKRVDKVLEQVEDIRRSCVTAILREAQTELAKTASSRERRTYAQHDIKRRVFKKRATDFLQQGIGNLKVLMEFKETGVPLHFLKVDDVNESTLPEISRVEPISKDLIVFLKESVQQLQSKAKELFESAVGVQYMALSDVYRFGNLLRVSFYDIVQNKRSTGQPLAEERRDAAITTWNSKVIVAGGSLYGKVTRSVKTFDPLNNTWTAFPNLQKFRHNHALVNLNGSLYAIGGYDENKIPLSSAERFNTESNTWEPAFTLLTARAKFAAVDLLSRLFITGGKTLDSCELASCETYRGPAFQVACIAPLNNSRIGHTAAANVDTVYVFGGKNKDNRKLETVEQYDRHADQWTVVLRTELNWNSAACCCSVSVYRIYRITRKRGHDNTIYKTVVQPYLYENTKQICLPHGLKLSGDECFLTSIKRTSPTTNNTKACTIDAKMHRSEASTTSSLPFSSSLIMKNLLVCTGGDLSTRSINSTSVFDIEGNSWHYMENCREQTYSLLNFAVVTWNNTVVVAGGYKYGSSLADSVEQFDPLTGKWTTLPNLKIARSGHALVNVKGSLYVFGGHTIADYHNVTVERYDANEREWVMDGNLRNRRKLFGAASCEKGVVVSGGFRRMSCELYDTKRSSSTIIACLNIFRSNHASATHDDTVYVFGGYRTTSIEQYDANANSWTLLHVRLTSTIYSLSTFLQAVCLQDKIYISSSEYDNILCFDPLKIVCASVPKRTRTSSFEGIAAINVTKDQWERILVSTKDSVNSM